MLYRHRLMWVVRNLVLGFTGIFVALAIIGMFIQ